MLFRIWWEIVYVLESRYWPLDEVAQSSYIPNHSGLFVFPFGAGLLHPLYGALSPGFVLGPIRLGCPPARMGSQEWTIPKVTPGFCSEGNWLADAGREPGSNRHSCKACLALGPRGITVGSNKDGNLFCYFKIFQGGRWNVITVIFHIVTESIKKVCNAHSVLFVFMQNICLDIVIFSGVVAKLFYHVLCLFISY